MVNKDFIIKKNNLLMVRNLHIVQDSHIVNDFIKFNDQNFSNENHLYFLFSRKNKIKKLNKFIGRNDFKPFSFINFIFFIKLILSDETKIMIHGLFDRILVPLFIFFPIKFNNLYWFLWGADVYNDFYKNSLKHNLFSYFKKIFIEKVKYVVTYLDGDTDFLKTHYNFNGSQLFSILYNSNIFINEVKETSTENINPTILIGNSSVPENNHLKVMKLISSLKGFKTTKILVPLSYGDFNYRTKVINEGKILFKNKFEPIIDMLQINDYYSKIDKVDIAIFDHRYQMAMGNIILLLGKGKAVFLNKDTSPYKFFNQNGIKVFDLNNFNFEFINKIMVKNWKSKNIKQIKKIFNQQNLVNQYSNIYKY